MSARVSAEALFSDLDNCPDRPLSSVTLRRIFTSLLKVHWSDSRNFGEFEDALGCLTYSDNTPETMLTIAPTHAFYDQATTQTLPGIFVGMGIDYRKSGLDDFAGYSADRSDTYRTVAATAKVAITHVHRQPDLALSMAECTTGFLLGIKDYLKERLGVSEITLLGLSDVNRLQQFDTAKFFGVDLAMRVTFNLGVTVNLESHRLKKFAAELRPT